jgi:hypothetical protein
MAVGCICMAPSSGQAQLFGTEAPAAPSISDRKLDAAATALVLVTRLRHDYRRQIAEAAPGERKRTTDEANSALEKVVTDEGLSCLSGNGSVAIVRRRCAGNDHGGVLSYLGS